MEGCQCFLALRKWYGLTAKRVGAVVFSVTTMMLSLR